MKLEDQVCSLEISMQLRKLGVKRESLYYWHLHIRESVERLRRMGECDWDKEEIINEENSISAFSVAELGEMLPEGYYVYKMVRVWRSSLLVNGNPIVTESNEADARAKLLIWLIENSKVKV